MKRIFKLKTLLARIEGPNREKCLKLLEDNLDRFEQAPGSLSKHQAWVGGYIDHLVETMKAGISIYETTNTKRKHIFSISDFILVLFLHDLEKPFKYVEPTMTFSSDESKEIFIDEIIDEYKIELNDQQKNALRYIHGEGDDFSPTERIQEPLAAFCHVCDVFSARIWFDYPKS